MKKLVTSASLLKIVDLEKDYIVSIDASIEGSRRVLMQDKHVIFYGSRNLKGRDNNLATHDLELATIVHALRISRHLSLELTTLV